MWNSCCGQFVLAANKPRVGFAFSSFLFFFSGPLVGVLTWLLSLCLVLALAL